jgi:hypothetical protein
VIKAERKKEMIDNMTKKYGNVTVGIHGNELPKFKGQYEQDGQMKDWWKSAKSFTASPKNRSLTKLNQDRKWWAKNDEMRLADISEKEAP